MTIASIKVIFNRNEIGKMTMPTITLNSRISSDGFLHLKVPSALTNTASVAWVKVVKVGWVER